MNEPSPLPRRIQRRRTAGWRMPPGTLYVGRGTAYGNPHLVAEHGRAEALRLYAEHLHGNPALAARIRRDLTGRDLACWCPPDRPCHADLLLAVAAGSGLPPVG